MTLFEINKLFTDGTLSKMYKAGYITTKIFNQIEIYLLVDDRVKKGFNKNKAVKEAANKLKVSDRTIWRALSNLNNKGAQL